MSFNNEIDAARIPRHVAIIMDGNGRWAKSQRVAAYGRTPRGGGNREKDYGGSRQIRCQILDFIYVLHRKLESSGTRDCGTHGVDSRPS